MKFRREDHYTEATPEIESPLALVGVHFLVVGLLCMLALISDYYFNTSVLLPLLLGGVLAGGELFLFSVLVKSLCSNEPLNLQHSVVGVIVTIAKLLLLAVGVMAFRNLSENGAVPFAIGLFSMIISGWYSGKLKE